jgi:hypothetical protein
MLLLFGLWPLVSAAGDSSAADRWQVLPSASISDAVLVLTLPAWTAATLVLAAATPVGRLRRALFSIAFGILALSLVLLVRAMDPGM